MVSIPMLHNHIYDQLYGCSIPFNKQIVCDDKHLPTFCMDKLTRENVPFKSKELTHKQCGCNSLFN